MAGAYTIDDGNSHCSVGVFEGDRLVRTAPLDRVRLPGDGARVIHSSVRGAPLPGLDAAGLFADGRLLDMPVRYSRGLGTDRLVSAYGVYRGEGTPTTVVVDAGTFMTVDVVGGGGFMGGVILPGLGLYLGTFAGARLPVLPKESLAGARPSLLANSTEEAVLQGLALLLGGLRSEVEALEPGDLVLTGGGAAALEGLFPKARAVPHLIHLGLKKVLDESLRRGG